MGHRQPTLGAFARTIDSGPLTTLPPGSSRARRGSHLRIAPGTHSGFHEGAQTNARTIHADDASKSAPGAGARSCPSGPDFAAGTSAVTLSPARGGQPPAPTGRARFLLALVCALGTVA